MNWNWLRNLRRTRSQASSKALVKRAMRLIGFPSVQAKPGLWIATADVNHGYAVTLNLLVHDWFVMCMVSANVLIDRVWIQRELALVLLEENHHFAYGSFRLSPRPDGSREVVIGHLLDTTRFDAEATADVSLILIEQMQSAITRLYAQSLICEGPVKTPSINSFQS